MYSEKSKPSVKYFAEGNVEEITEGLDDVERELALNIALHRNPSIVMKAECIIKLLRRR